MVYQNSNTDSVSKLKYWWYIKTQILMVYQNSNTDSVSKLKYWWCIKTQILIVYKNSNTDRVSKLKYWFCIKTQIFLYSMCTLLIFYLILFFGNSYCIKVTFNNNYRYDALSIGLISIGLMIWSSIDLDIHHSKVFSSDGVNI